MTISQHLQRSHNPVASATLPLPPRILAQPVLTNTNGIVAFESFDRSIKRVGHMCVDPRISVSFGTRPHASAYRLVVSERPAAGGVNSADRDIVHGPAAGGGNAIRNGFGESPKKQVHDSLCRLDIAARGGRRIHCVENGALRNGDLERSHQTSAGRYIFGSKAAKDVEDS